MEYVALGKTNLLVSRTGFGAESLDCKEIESFGEDADEKACAIVHPRETLFCSIESRKRTVTVLKSALEESSVS